MLREVQQSFSNLQHKSQRVINFPFTRRGAIVRHLSEPLVKRFDGGVFNRVVMQAKKFADTLSVPNAIERDGHQEPYYKGGKLGPMPRIELQELEKVFFGVAFAQQLIFIRNRRATQQRESRTIPSEWFMAQDVQEAFEHVMNVQSENATDMVLRAHVPSVQDPEAVKVTKEDTKTWLHTIQDVAQKFALHMNAGEVDEEYISNQVWKIIFARPTRSQFYLDQIDGALEYLRLPERFISQD